MTFDYLNFLFGFVTAFAIKIALTVFIFIAPIVIEKSISTKVDKQYENVEAFNSRFCIAKFAKRFRKQN